MPKPVLRLALAQLNVTVGDFAGNQQLIAAAIRHAQSWMAQVVVVPELAVCGYPPEDLLLKPQFVAANRRAVDRLAPLSRGIVALVGFVDRDRTGRLYNAAAILADGRHAGTYHKQCLPNYGVFDEKRYFAPGDTPGLFELNGVKIGVTICEDLWQQSPCATLAARGAQLVLNLSASPYHAGKLKERERLFAHRARSHRVPIAYCNLVGGQDELVFDGGSLLLGADGRVLRRGPQFEAATVLADAPCAGSRRNATPARARRIRVVLGGRAAPPPIFARPVRPRAPVEEIYDALTLGLRDYVRKNGFSTVVLGLSGGIDSALTACLAADALGPAHVIGVVMPSRFSSKATQADARAVGRALGIEVHDIPIEPIVRAYHATLKPFFGNRPADSTEQNIQARARGNVLMALSNKFGWLVLTTGNKSEMATGYCTLYGDMAGGVAVIKDVPKTLVYRLARSRHQRQPGGLIPESVFERAPTAELAPNQTDQDTLPPYEVLDRVLKAVVEEDRSPREIARRTRINPAIVAQVLRMVDRSEYKRRQAPPGMKITPRAFGKDRRMPITNRYQESQ